MQYAKVGSCRQMRKKGSVLLVKIDATATFVATTISAGWLAKYTMEILLVMLNFQGVLLVRLMLAAW